MTISKGKGPRDPNQIANRIVGQSTSEIPDDSIPVRPEPPVPATVSEYMASIGRKGGQIGGKRRLKTMTEEQRRKIAKKAARARWSKRKA